MREPTDRRELVARLRESTGESERGPRVVRNALDERMRKLADPRRPRDALGLRGQRQLDGPLQDVRMSGATHESVVDEACSCDGVAALHHQ